MKPVLFTIGNFNVYSFGFLLVMAFLFTTYFVWKFGKEELKEDEYMDGFLYASVISIITARIVYILFHREEFSFNILRFILVRETPGLSLLGGLLGGFIFLLWYCRQKKIPALHFLDRMSVPVSFSLFLVKIGELLGGAVFGRETSSFIGVQVAGLTGRHHPVEMYEGLLYCLLFFSLLLIYNISAKKKWPDGVLFQVFLVFFFIFNLIMEYFKIVDPLYLNLTLRQIVSGILALVVMIPLLKNGKIIYNMYKSKKI